MDNLKTTYFPALTGVRAVAAIMVFVHHFNSFSKDVFGNTVHGMARELHIGVTLFFVLSGFLIAYRYSDLRAFNFKKYFLYRFARIYPLYFILTTLTFVFFLFQPVKSANNDFGVYLLNITFLRGYFDQFKFSLVEQGWSLTIEETFYVVAPFAFLLLKKSKYNLLVLPVLLVLIGLALTAIFEKQDLNGFFGNYEFTLNYTFFGRCFEFFTGIGLALMIKNQVKLPAYSTYTGLLFIVLSVYGLQLLQGEGYSDYGIRSIYGKMINTLFLPLVGILLFYYGLINEKTILSRILSSRIAVVLGKSSYIFYLIHKGLINDWLPKSGNSALDYIGSFMILQVIAILLFYFVEDPLNKKIRLWVDKRHRESALQF